MLQLLYHTMMQHVKDTLQKEERTAALILALFSLHRKQSCWWAVLVIKHRCATDTDEHVVPVFLRPTTISFILSTLKKRLLSLHQSTSFLTYSLRAISLLLVMKPTTVPAPVNMMVQLFEVHSSVVQTRSLKSNYIP